MISTGTFILVIDFPTSIFFLLKRLLTLGGTLNSCAWSSTTELIKQLVNKFS